MYFNFSEAKNLETTVTICVSRSKECEMEKADFFYKELDMGVNFLMMSKMSCGANIQSENRFSLRIFDTRIVKKC